MKSVVPVWAVIFLIVLAVLALAILLRRLLGRPANPIGPMPAEEL